MDKDKITVTDPNFRYEKSQAIIDAEEQRRIETLKAAHEKEQQRFNRKTLLDRFLEAIFKTKKKSAEIDQTHQRQQQNQR